MDTAASATRLADTVAQLPGGNHVRRDRGGAAAQYDRVAGFASSRGDGGSTGAAAASSAITGDDTAAAMAELDAPAALALERWDKYESWRSDDDFNYSGGRRDAADDAEGDDDDDGDGFVQRKRKGKARSL